MGYIVITLIMLNLYIDAFDPYIDDSKGFGSFCVASSIFSFLIYRYMTRHARKAIFFNLNSI